MAGATMERWSISESKRDNVEVALVGIRKDM